MSLNWKAENNTPVWLPSLDLSLSNMGACKEHSTHHQSVNVGSEKETVRNQNRNYTCRHGARIILERLRCCSKSKVETTGSCETSK